MLYFFRSTSIFNPPLLNLSALGGPILCSKNTQKYLGFYFNRKLLFHHHIDYYENKTILTVKYMKILRNLSHSLIPHQKCLLYRSCVLPITLYNFQLWHYNKTPLLYPLKVLNKIQRRATIWILRAFQISTSFGIKAIAGLILIYIHLCKLSGKAQLRAHTLPDNHILRLLLKTRSSFNINLYHLSLNSLTPC